MASLQLSVTLRDAAGNILTGRSVSWSTSNAGVATVSVSGLVTSVAAGTCTITATSEGKTGTCSVVVQAVGVGKPDVALVVTRFKAGTGTTLVSNGIPLPPGYLMAADLNKVRIFLGLQEQSIYVEALKGLYPDGSLRSILVQFNALVTQGSILNGTMKIGTTRGTVDIVKTPISNTFNFASDPSLQGFPDAVALPSDTQYLCSCTGVFHGGIRPRSLGPTNSPWAGHESAFDSQSNLHWSKYATYTSANTTVTVPDIFIAGTNYYDRAMIHYVQWARSGNLELFKRACSYLMSWRWWAQNTSGSTYSMQPHNYQPEGMAMHYWLTGDPESRNGVNRLGQVAYLGGAPNGFVALSTDKDHVDGRMQARVLLVCMLCAELELTDQTWSTIRNTALNNIMNSTTWYPDGSNRSTSSCYQASNFMHTVLVDAFMKYYEHAAQDSRILPKVKGMLDFLYPGQWRAGDTIKSFNYYSGFCQQDYTQGRAGGDATATVDLDMMYPDAWYWYAWRANNAGYQAIGNIIFQSAFKPDGTPYSTSLSYEKQYNEPYCFSIHMSEHFSRLTPASGCSLITDVVSHVIPALAKPGYLQTVIDPAFGTKIIRVAGDPGTPTGIGGNWPSISAHNYSLISTWNSDESLAVFLGMGATGLGNAFFIDGNTYAPKYGRFAAGNEIRWHPSQPQVMLYCLIGGEYGFWNVVTNAKDIHGTLVGYSNVQFGPYEGNPSANGQYMILSATRNSDSHVVAKLWDTVGRTIGADIDLTSQGLTSLDWVGMSPSGNHIIVHGVISGVSQQIRLLTRAGVFERNLGFSGHPNYGTDAAGNEAQISINNGINWTPLGTGIKTVMTPGNENNGHTSYAPQRPGWMYISTYQGAGNFPNDIYAIKMQAGQTVNRLAHHRSTASVYDSSPFACASPSGKRVIFRSDWGTPGSVQSYVIDTRTICPTLPT